MTPDEVYEELLGLRCRCGAVIVALRPELDGVIELRALRSERRKR